MRYKKRVSRLSGPSLKGRPGFISGPDQRRMRKPKGFGLLGNPIGFTPRAGSQSMINRRDVNARPMLCVRIFEPPVYKPHKRNAVGAAGYRQHDPFKRRQNRTKQIFEIVIEHDKRSTCSSPPT